MNEQESVGTTERTCPQCGAEIVYGKKFCVKCGAQVVQFCPNCGAEQILGEPFCGTCGASLTGSAEAGSAGLKPVGFLAAWKRGWKFSTQGRASRGEYWWRMLSLVMEGFLLAIVYLLIVGVPCEWDFEDASVVAVSIASVVYALWLLPMCIALLFLRIRRLHDQGLSGWWVLLWNTPPIIGLIFALRPGTRGPNQFGPVPGIRPDELQAAGEKSAVLRLWAKAGEAELRFDTNIRKVFLILTGCLAAIGLCLGKRIFDSASWGPELFWSFVPFIGFLLLAFPGKTSGLTKTGMVLETASAIIVLLATVGSLSYFSSVWKCVWAVCFGAFVWVHLYKRQEVKKVCAWVLAGWCLFGGLYGCFHPYIQSFWKRMLLFGQCALWMLLALKEGRSGLVASSQGPDEG